MGSIDVGYENYNWISISINLHIAFYIHRIGHGLELIGLVGQFLCHVSMLFYRRVLVPNPEKRGGFLLDW